MSAHSNPVRRVFFLFFSCSILRVSKKPVPVDRRSECACRATSTFRYTQVYMLIVCLRNEYPFLALQGEDATSPVFRIRPKMATPLC